MRKLNPKSDLALFYKAANPLYVAHRNKVKSDWVEWRLVDHLKRDFKLSIIMRATKVSAVFEYRYIKQ